MEGGSEVKNEEAYALVTATFRGVRYVLLVETDAGWAMPAGAIEPGEKPGQAAVRELREKTGFSLSLAGVLNESRDGIVVARCDLGEVGALPEVRGGGDARQARWIGVGYLGWAEGYLFPAHREILEALR